jgi:hypothetical protein
MNGARRDGKRDSSSAKRLESPASTSLNPSRGGGSKSESTRDGSEGLEGMGKAAGLHKREEEGNMGVAGAKEEEGKLGDETIEGR